MREYLNAKDRGTLGMPPEMTAAIFELDYVSPMPWSTVPEKGSHTLETNSNITYHFGVSVRLRSTLSVRLHSTL